MNSIDIFIEINRDPVSDELYFYNVEFCYDSFEGYLKMKVIQTWFIG
jgi:hypothetical protein